MKEGVEMELPAKRYIGDGVYVEHNGFGIVLTTENGIEVTNRIVLEPEVVVALEGYFRNVRAAVTGADRHEKDQHGAGR